MVRIVHIFQSSAFLNVAASNQKNMAFLSKKPSPFFYDEFAMKFYDDGHSEEEHRFLMLGFSCESRMLLVCHCERESRNTIRIISARKATKNECSHYKGNVP